MLRITNNDAGSDDTALDLRVQSGEPPMTVNSSAKVASLNADKLDGNDSSQFVPTSTYSKTVSFFTTQNSTTGPAGVSCDDGDVLLSGGVKLNDPPDQKIGESRPVDPVTWAVTVRDDNATTGAGFDITVLCADLGEPHTG